MTDQLMTQIRFRLAGPPLAQVIRWQQEVDLRVFGYQIEARGRALAIIYEGETRPHHFTHLPEPGQAIPWYGAFGAAHRFTFRPADEGYHLRVEMIKAGHERFYPDAMAPLELSVPERIVIEPAAAGQLWWGMGWGWWCRSVGESPIDELIFILNSEMYTRLEEWGWDRRRWQTYAYSFIPLSVGCEMYVQDTITGAEEHLTKDICW